MVNPSLETASSEDAPSPEVTESLPMSGDEPLIPRDFDDRFTGDATEEVATGDEAASDDSATESQELPETTEETPAAETTTTETTPTETAPAEGEEPAPRTYTADEWGNRESSYRTRDTEQTKALEYLQTQVTQMQSQYQNNIVDAEARAFVSALTQQYTDEGQDERTASTRAQREIDNAKADWQTQQTNAQLRQQLQASKQSEEQTATRASVDHLMREHGVPEAQRSLLLGYTDPALAIDTAKALGEAETLRKNAIAARQAEVPSGGEANKFDGGTGAGGTQTDDQWLETQYNTGIADSPADDARAFKILTAQGTPPQF